MDLTKAGLIVALVVLVVILLNIGMYLAFSRKDGQPGTIELLMKAGKRVKNPWEDEDNALEELSEIVKELKAQEHTSMGNNEDFSNDDSNNSN